MDSRRAAERYQRAAKRRLGEMLRERGYAPRQVRVAGHRTIVWEVVP